MKIKKRTLRYVAGAAILLAIAYFLLPVITGQPLAEPTPTPAPTPSPEPSTTPTPSVPPGEMAAKQGDNVSVEYTLWSNGLMIDTSIESNAREAGIYNPQRNYAPFSFVIGASQVIPGFENAVMGMKIGESKQVTIAPKDGYGEYDPMQQRAVMDTYTVPRQETYPASIFWGMFPDFDISQNDTVVVDVWNATVLSITSETATLRFNPNINDTRPGEYGSFPETIYDVNETTISIRRNAEVGESYVWYDETGNGRWGVATSVGDGVIMLDFNHPLAGQELNFELKLVAINGVSG